LLCFISSPFAGAGLYFAGGINGPPTGGPFSAQRNPPQSAAFAIRENLPLEKPSRPSAISHSSSLRLNFEFNVECYDEAGGLRAFSFKQLRTRLKPIRAQHLAKLMKSDFTARLQYAMPQILTKPAMDELDTDAGEADPSPLSPRLKRLLFWGTTTGVIIAALLVWRHLQSAGNTDPLYRHIAVQRGNVTATVSASGPLSAVSTVNVGSQVSGNIFRLHVDFNDPVKTGQLLAEIEPSTYEAVLDQAEGDLANAQAALELKQLAANRAGQLMAKALISQADHDQVTAELHEQQALVRIKEAAQKNAAINLGRTRIYSPVDGVVIDRTIDIGQTVQANFSAPTLFVLAQDLRQMQVTANVSEADIGGVAPKEAVSFTVDAFPGRAFAGEVRQVRNNSTITNNVVTYSTIIAVDNSELKLRPGMTANVVITIASRSNVLRVPNSALRFRPTEEPPTEISHPAGPRHTLYVLHQASGTTARSGVALTPIEVTPGLTDNAYTEIMAGLDEGAAVVTGIALPGEAASDDATRNPFMPRMPTGRNTGRQRP
jgi:HlyD family secretion protein